MTNKHWQLRLAFIAPCPAPRFDTFTDRILGPWEDYNHRPGESTCPTTSTNIDRERGEVEEVMQLCRSAVHGIKTTTNGLRTTGTLTNASITTEWTMDSYSSTANRTPLYQKNVSPLPRHHQPETTRPSRISYAVSRVRRIERFT